MAEMNDPRDCREALMRHASQVSVWIAGVAAVLLAGCGKADPRGPRVPVHGEVRLDGQPLLAGVILFHCNEGEDKLTAVGYIENGGYAIAKQDGPLVGTARVEFQAKPVPRDQFEAALDEAARTRRRPQLDIVAIPPQYGQASQLTAEVTRDGNQPFDFDLRSDR
jgi:hypothetical protein